uniref:Uncharacterized protein n=1 Tax=Tetranychus urticae TaxID=32264 RepID=T1KUQ1_TETUR
MITSLTFFLSSLALSLTAYPADPVYFSAL